MMNTILVSWKKITLSFFFFLIIEIALIIVFLIKGTQKQLLFAFIIFGVNLLIIAINLLFTYFILKRYLLSSQQVLNQIESAGYDVAGLGICIYDSEHNICWVNSFIKKIETKNIIGQNINDWIPGIEKISLNSNLKINIKKNSFIYEVRVLHNNNVIFLKDITNYRNALEMYQNDEMIFGIININNLKNIIAIKGVKTEYMIKSVIEKEINGWAIKYNIFLQSLDVSNYIFISKREILEKKILTHDKFSFVKNIVNQAFIKKEGISMSVGVGYGTNDANLLYQIAIDNLKRAEARGGNEIIVRNYNEENRVIFTLKTAIQERTTLKDIRYFASKLKRHIHDASDILIIGHRWGDYDCIGSALGIYEICKNLQKPARIVIDFNYLDKNAHDNIDKLIPSKQLKEIYISPKNLEKQVNEKTLFIVMDTHIASRIEAPLALKNANKVIVIDHHILGEANSIKATDEYIESKASSTSEIVTFILDELLPNSELEQFVLDLLFTGIVLDTNYFRNRTTQKTFEASSILKGWGANSKVASEILKDTIETLQLKQKIIEEAFEIATGILLAVGNDDLELPKSMLAQVAQELTNLKGVKAAFVIAKSDESITSMSARSDGKINVQVIAEKLGGGGHLNAAAVQNNEMSIEEMTNRLKIIIDSEKDNYTIKKGDKDESNFN